MRLLPALLLVAAAALGVTFAPPSAAQEPQAHGMTSLIFSPFPGNGTLFAAESITLRNSGDAAYTGPLHVYTAAGAMGVTVTLSDSSFRESTALWTPTAGPEEGGFVLWSVDLAARNWTFAANTTATFAAHYYLPQGDAYGYKTYYNHSSIRLTILPAAGEKPEIEGVALSRTPGSSSQPIWTGTLTGAQAASGAALSIRFVPDPGPATEKGGLSALGRAFVRGLELGPLVLSALVGAVVMYLLARGGLVPTAGPPGKGAGASAPESRASLEARKLFLMAGLKELELARKEGHVPQDVYEPLKAEYKQQAVRVMRELSEGTEPKR